MARTKFATLFCPYCKKETKMELLGGVPTDDAATTEPVKAWYRCSKCKHTNLISLEVMAQEKAAANAPLEREKCVTYSKEQTYSVGNCIYHIEWDDMGKVVRKDKTSGGNKIIVVEFEKLGERKLLENVHEETEELVDPK
jgi:hypothetical protein